MKKLLIGGAVVLWLAVTLVINFRSPACDTDPEGVISTIWWVITWPTRFYFC